jgi:hypothetical protein
MSREQLGARGLDQLRDELSGRDLAIVGQVAELRLMSARQLEAVHFPSNEHDSQAAAARACRRSLDRLAQHRLLVRAERRIGGVRAGSASYCYSLGPVGQRVLNIGGPRRRFREPSTAFAIHTLAVAQLVVDLTLATRQKQFDLLVCQAEPRCWRQFNAMGGATVLRPDLFLSLGVSEFEHRWFVEVDRGTEHLPALVRKCRLYDAYYRSGREQATYQVFPRVCWLVPDEARVLQLQGAITGDQQLTRGLFCVTTTKQALKVLARGPS